jgi:hypothetical protein
METEKREETLNGELSMKRKWFKPELTYLDISQTNEDDAFEDDGMGGGISGS